MKESIGKKTITKTISKIVNQGLRNNTNYSEIHEGRVTFKAKEDLSSMNTDGGIKMDGT